MFMPFAPAFSTDAKNGLTVYDYIATAALQGILAIIPPSDLIPEAAAGLAVKCADALVKELSAKHAANPRP